jgi:hypothetical protein
LDRRYQLGFPMQNMSFATVVAIAAVGIAAFVTNPAAAAGRSKPVIEPTATPPTDLSAQYRPRYRRARTRILIYPARPLYRQCVDWYAVERRATGDTVVPHMQCHWVYR